jgi:hypothetical protein
VPLSEEEQRILEEIERELIREDPEFVRQVEESSVFRHALRTLVGWSFLAAVGIGLVLAGLVTSLLLASIAGFAVALVAVGGVMREIGRLSRAAQDLRRQRLDGWSARRGQGVGGSPDS